MKNEIISRLFAVCIVLFISSVSFAEVVKKDTIPYTGDYELIIKTKINDYGEITNTYQCILKQGNKERKIPVDKKTYQSGKITHIIYNIDAEGNKRLAKAINIQ